MEQIKKQPKYKYEYPKGTYKQSAKLSDPEYRKLKNKEHYEKHKEKIIKQQKERYRLNHPKGIKEVVIKETKVKKYTKRTLVKEADEVVDKE